MRGVNDVRRALRMAPAVSRRIHRMDDKDFAREALAWFFRHRDAAGKAYCAACLAVQLTRYTYGAFSDAALQVVLAECFEDPGPLRVTPRGLCAGCRGERVSGWPSGGSGVPSQGCCWWSGS